MKMFKRFAAALLVGVMALAMLTACSNDGTTPIGAEFENKIAAAVGMKNDPELRAQALALLDNVDTDGTIAADKVAIGDDEESNLAGMVITEEMMNRLSVQEDTAANKIYHAKAVDASMIATIVDMVKGDAEGITRIGVATKLVNGKTYAAFVVELATELE